jgi:hypothetical protein
VLFGRPGSRAGWSTCSHSRDARFPLPPFSLHAQAFRYIDDIKAGVPRTAYKGIVSLKHNGCRKFIVPTATLDANNALPH